MLVLALDTATPAVTAALVRITTQTSGEFTASEVVAARVHHDARAHAEILTPQLLACLEEAQVSGRDLAAVVVGAGPGPFTGLRVGMATAAALADAWGIPVYPVGSLDAIALDCARELPDSAEFVVVTDARRREVYWARYRGSKRLHGPAVDKPADVSIAGAQAIAGSPAHTALFELPVVPIHTPPPAGLVDLAAPAIRAGQPPEPLTPLYLRRPDAVEKAWARTTSVGAAG